MPCHIILRATNPSLNMDRIYELWLGKGLLGKWVVIVAHGPYKGGMTQRSYAFDNKQDAQMFIDKVVTAKLHSEKRIGQDYKVVHDNRSHDY